MIPFAALVTKEKYNTAEQVSLGHYTHEKSPLGCAAALATMEVIEEEGLLNQAKQHGQTMQERLLAMKARYPLIGDVRGIGMLWAVELVTDRISKHRANQEAEAVLYECLNLGLSFKVSQGNVLQLSPPLIISDEQLEEALSILEQAIAKVSDDFKYRDAEY